MKKIIVVFVLVFFIILGILVFNDESKTEKNIEEINNEIIGEDLVLQDENIKNNEGKNIAVEDDELENLCNAKPIQLAIGRDEFPIDKKYSNLNFLGQIFTAYDCGGGRINKIFGVNDGVYTLGSTVWLKDNPDKNLINTFKSIGFSCVEKDIPSECKKWRLDGNVKIDDLIKLEPYYNYFKSDDCIHCG